jgi:hypothetical protein
MKSGRLLQEPLTIAQAQNAAALDDLLRFIVIGDGFTWYVIPKATRKVSYEGMYDVILSDLVGGVMVVDRPELIVQEPKYRQTIAAKVEGVSVMSRSRAGIELIQQGRDTSSTTTIPGLPPLNYRRPCSPSECDWLCEGVWKFADDQAHSRLEVPRQR